MQVTFMTARETVTDPHFDTKVIVIRMDGARKDLLISGGEPLFDTTAAMLRDHLCNFDKYPIGRITMIDGTVVYDSPITYSSSVSL